MIIIVHVLVAIGITGLVLLQQGKGADMGASFGSGASQTIFGSTGSGNALTKSTSWLAVIFFVTSLALALLARQQASQGIQQSSLIENLDQLEQVQNAAPAQDIPQAPALEAGSDIPQAPEAMEAVETEAAVDAAEAEAAVEEGVEETEDATEDATEAQTEVPAEAEEQ